MIDRARIYVRGGDGGNGLVGFRREKYVPRGGPDGGDGGWGGSVYLQADHGLSTLLPFRYRRQFKAGNGAPGGSNNKHGAAGEGLLVLVPVGTVVQSLEGEKLMPLADLSQPGQKLLVARGGRGGFGNAHYASSTNRAPRLAQKGEEGEEVWLQLDLKLLADVGLVGYPNVGKSSLLAAVSAARPKIADYPFTTVEPVLGVVEVGDFSFVLADIPGLIEGAHLGRGLGHDFLRHIERTRLLIHVLDGTSPEPWADRERVNQELALYNAELAEKPQLLAVNKIDLPEVRERIPQLMAKLEPLAIPLFFISAATGEGVPALMAQAAGSLRQIWEQPRPPLETETLPILRPQPRRPRVQVTREDGLFVVKAPEAERLAALTDLGHWEARAQLLRQLRRMGIGRALERAGAQPGDLVRLGQVQILWE